MENHKKNHPESDARPPKAPVSLLRAFFKVFHRGGDENLGARQESTPKRRYSYLLEFRCRGTLVFSEKTDNMGECVKIGRSPENDWVIPQEDRLSSDFHARLNLSPKEITITACKGKNFRFKGKETTSKKLAPNDRITIGDCELLVSHSEHSANSPCDVHRLEFLNGQRAGAMVRLESASIRIGSAKDNDIVLGDDVVSGRHAELKISPDGETWLKDLGSQNGTFVNGAKMGRTERMLMDSDIISIAHYDLRFLDKNVIHTRTNISRKLFAVFITAILTICAFGAFYAFTPRSETVLDEYDSLLKNNDFDGARALLAKLPYSREFDKFAAEYQDYQNSLSRYETVFQMYNKFKEHLKNSEWRKATSCIGQLNLDNRVDWNWNEARADEYIKEVAHAKACLLKMYQLSNLLSDTDLPAEKMKAELMEIEKTPFGNPEFGKSEPEYLIPLCEIIVQKVGDMRQNVNNLKLLDAILNGINWESVDMQETVSKISAIKHKSMGGVRMKAQNAEEILKKISSNIAAVKANQQFFYNLQFDKINREINFISADDCLNYESISKMRAQIINRNALILKNTEALKYVISNLREYGMDSKVPKLAKDFNSKQAWERLLSFKSLDAPAPTHPQDTFADEYDKMLGFKYFYDIIAQIPTLSTNIFAADILLPEEYHPECITLSEIYKAADEASLWFSIPENKWMLKGKVAQLRDRVSDVLKERGNLLKLLDKFAEENPDGRKFFVAKAAFFYFSPSGSVSKDDLDDFSKKWRTFRQRQYSAWEKYNPIDSGNMEKIKKEILSKGIPGDPIVNGIWK